MGDSLGQQGRRRKAEQSPPKHSDEVTIPAEYLGHLLDVARRFHVRAEPLLRGTGISLNVLEEQGAVVPRACFIQAVERALTLTGEPGLGYHLGLSLKLSSHGALGMLAMTSGTLGDALQFLERYAELRAAELTLRLGYEGDFFVLEFGTHAPTQLQVFFSESMFVMFLQLGRALLGHALNAHCEMPFPEPAHFRRFAHLLPGGVTFGASTNRLRAPKALLDEAVVTSDSVMARRIERECQRELASLRERASVVIALRRQLRSEAGDYPSLESIAERMGYSVRTLKRKLKEQGTGYRAVVDELRREHAIGLLRSTALSIEDIAHRVGYADVASFHRSFRRWYTSTPDAYRKLGELRPRGSTTSGLR